MKEAGTNGIPPGIFKPHLINNKELQRIEEHQPLETSSRYLVPLLLSPLCTLKSPSMFSGWRQLPLPLFSKWVVACVKSGQSRLSLESVNSMTNIPWHKPNNSFLAVAMRKMLISNSGSCPWCSRGFWAQGMGYKDLLSSTWSPNLISIITDCTWISTYGAIRANSP